MEGIKDALLRMVTAARTAKELDEKLTGMGYGETPYSAIYGDIADAIYYLIGEHTEIFDESLTHTMLTAPFMDNERRAANLHYVFVQHQLQPKPETMERREMEDLHRKNGGYMTPEGEWV